MLNMRKKISTVVLLLIVAVPLFFSAGFIIQQQLIKMQAAEQLKTVTLQTISIPAASAKWHNENRELVIEGKLFDVRSFRIINNELIATGLFDEEEDKLNEQLKHFVEKENNNNSTLDNLLVEFFSLTMYTTAADHAVALDWRYVASAYHNYSETIPIAPFLSKNPPPDLQFA